MSFPSVRAIRYQNPTSGRIWDVRLYLQASGAVTGLGHQMGVNRDFADPMYDNTKVSFVVVTTQVGKVFGTAFYQDEALAAGAYYDASVVGNAGALLSTLLA